MYSDGRIRQIYFTPPPTLKINSVFYTITLHFLHKSAISQNCHGFCTHFQPRIACPSDKNPRSLFAGTLPAAIRAPAKRQKIRGAKTSAEISTLSFSKKLCGNAFLLQKQAHAPGPRRHSRSISISRKNACGTMPHCTRIPRRKHTA